MKTTQTTTEVSKEIIIDTQEDLLLSSEESEELVSSIPVTTSVTRKHVNLTTTEIHIDLPIYLPNSSHTPESYLKFYTSEMHTVIVDDEATDQTVNGPCIRMKADDFNVVTEFPLTTEHPQACSHPPAVNHDEMNTSSNGKTEKLGATSAPEKQEKTADAGLVIPHDLQNNFIPNSCTATDFQNGNGCFCVIEELVARLKKGLHDKTLSENIDSYKCESFFKSKEGVLINNQTMDVRRKRSYWFLKQQLEDGGIVKRETVPYSEIESILKITSNIHNSGKGFQHLFLTSIFMNYITF